VGEIVGTCADVDVLTNGVVDIARLRPLLFDVVSRRYWALGDPVAKCWSVDKEYVGLRHCSLRGKLIATSRVTSAGHPRRRQRGAI
jgi:hypothetical protein